MTPFLNNGAKIKLKPDPGWSWEGWDGVLEVSPAKNHLKISGSEIILGQDVPMFTLKTDRAYKANEFKDAPGSISEAFFTVDAPINGANPLLKTTTGKFLSLYSSPSIKATSGGPVPDPVVLKTGTWAVFDINQELFSKIDQTYTTSVIKVYSPVSVDKKRENLRGIIREYEAVIILADNGYNVVHQPIEKLETNEEKIALRDTHGIGEDKNPDYIINGEVMDCYAPTTNASTMIYELEKKKVEEMQANVFIINLADTDARDKDVKSSVAELNEIRKKEGKKPIKVIIITKDKEIIPLP